MKDKITNVFQTFLGESNGCVRSKTLSTHLKSKWLKPNYIWIDKGSEFCNRWLEKSAIEMYLTHNETKSVVAERFIGTFKNKIYKYMTLISKNVYINKLDDLVSKYNNIYHSTNIMKPVDVIKM